MADANGLRVIARRSIPECDSLGHNVSDTDEDGTTLLRCGRPVGRWPRLREQGMAARTLVCRDNLATSD